MSRLVNIYSDSFKPNLIRVAFIIVGLIIALINTGSARALTEADRNYLSTPFYDESEVCAQTNNDKLNLGGKIYVIGDSLTVGMRDFGGLEQKLTENNWSVSDIEATVGDTVSDAVPKVFNDRDFVRSSDTIVVGLGTNTEANFAEKVDQMIAMIRNHSDQAKIYWINAYTTKSDYTDVNNTLNERKLALGFDVIDWKTEASNNPGSYPFASDGIHHTNEGYAAKANFVVSSLGGNNGESPAVSGAGCVCELPGAGTNEENEKNVWAYFISKGLAPEASAGLMGSIAPESGFNPQNVQDTAPVPDSPEIPIDAIRGRFGYGLIQWTSAGRQEALIRYASETNRSTGDLGLQLDFMWKEMNDSYTGTLTLLQTPGISVREASDEVTLHFVTPGAVTQKYGTPESKTATLNTRGDLSQNFFDKYSGQSVGYSSGASCNFSGSEIDRTSEDTSSIPCSGNTTDLGVAEGYRDGKLIKIRLCSVRGHKVNSQIAGSVEQMLVDAAADGVNITINGVFRSMEGQISIYNSWCSRGGITPTPPPYPKPSYSDYVRCPGAAPPGYSNHQEGLALDLECEEILIPQSYSLAKNNPCFQWLVENAFRTTPKFSQDST